MSIPLAYPIGTQAGCINVICGLNNSGKSFLLDQLRRVLKGKAHASVVTVEPLPRGQPTILFLGQTWQAKDDIGIVNLDQTGHALSIAARLGDYRRTALLFLASQMAPYFSPPSDGADIAARLADPGVRQQIEHAFVVGSMAYSCSRTDPLVQRLEALLGGRLYFHCSKRAPAGGSWQFEFVLAYEDGSTVPFRDWSDGQRACFYVLLSLAFIKPDIVLFDEVENHLHPAYMSHVLEALRSTPTQTVIATHHPHLIFTRHADRVYYMDTFRPGLAAALPACIPFSGQHMTRPFRRAVLRLEDDFERITSAYRLFDFQDDQLLRQATLIREHSATVLFRAVSSLFSDTPAPPRTSVLPDTQSMQLSARLKTFSRADGTVRVLDLGAGIGRVVSEVGKLSQWQLGRTVRWTCLESVPQHLAALQERFSGNSAVRIVADTAELKNAQFDLCLIANVLHELTPPEWAAFLCAADKHVDHSCGGVVILEVFPLLRPEAYAVPCDPGLLLDTLRALGFSCDCEQLTLRHGGAIAYCIFARRRKRPELVPKNVVTAVRRMWGAALKRSLSAYSLKETVRTPEQYVRLLSHLTTIASITAWHKQAWRSASQTV